MLWDTANPHLHRILVDSNCNWTNGSIWGSHLCVLMMPRRDAYLIWDLVSDTILKDGFHISSNHLVMIHAGVIVGMIVPVSGDVFLSSKDEEDNIQVSVYLVSVMYHTAARVLVHFLKQPHPYDTDIIQSVIFPRATNKQLCWNLSHIFAHF